MIVYLVLEQEEFCDNIPNQYSVTLPSLCQDSLDQALMNSLLHFRDVCLFSIIKIVFYILYFSSLDR
jgi:hypothetical protein